MKKIILSLIPFFSLVMLFNSGCKKITDCEDGFTTRYFFELPVSLSPAKDTFNIGDTIWIEQKFSHDFLNKNSNKYHRLENWDFRSTWGITNLNSPSPAISYQDPQIITYKGITTGNNIGSVKHQALSITYDYEDGYYNYKVAFIVDKPGAYFTAFFSYLNRDDVRITKCKSQTIYIDYPLNQKGDNNYEMLQYAKDDYYSSWSREEFDKSGGYCFHVK